MTPCVMTGYRRGMARWDPGAADRLWRAAMELYLERGFENVSVAEISECAGLTRRTFFRYFTDKRDVLFAGSERLPAAVAQAVHAAAPHRAALDIALNALRTVGTAVVDAVDRDHSRARRAVITASPELRERERTKLADCTDGLATALTERGTPEDTAAFVARLAVAVFETAFARWADRDEQEFTDHFDAAVDELVTHADTLN